MAVTFGRPDEWAAFERRHRTFFEVWPELQAVIDGVVSRRFDTDQPVQRVVYALGRLAVEDFLEIVLNAGNGYGVAALKLLRGLFERVITMMYLIRHPEETDRFLNFHWVHVRKTLNHLRAEGGDPGAYYGSEELAEVEARYEAVKGDYIEVICEACRTTRDGMSWTRRDLATLARDVGLRKAYLGLAYWPTLQLHSTVAGMALRFELTPEGGAAFKPGAQHQEADSALIGAHTCLSIALEEHVRYFGLPLETEHIRNLYQRCWPSRTGETGKATGE